MNSIFQDSQTFYTNKDDGLSEDRNDISQNLIIQNQEQQQPSATNQISSFQDKGELCKQESEQMKKDLVEVRKGNIILQDSQKELQAELQSLLMKEILSLDEQLQNMKKECKDDTMEMNKEFGQLKNEYKTVRCEYLIANNIYEELKKQDDIKKSVYSSL